MHTLRNIIRFVMLFVVPMIINHSQSIFGSSTAGEKKLKIALFVKSNSEEINYIQPKISALLSKRGLSVLNPELLLSEDSYNELKKTSYFRLAQNLQSDYFIVVTAYYNNQKKNFNDASLGINTQINTHLLEYSYNLQQTSDGVTIAGDTIIKEKKIINSTALKQSKDDIISSLVNDCAEELSSVIANAISGRINKLKSADLFEVSFNVIPDNNLGAFNSIPSFLGPEGEKYELDIKINADVILNGLLAGSTSETLMIPKGIHDLKIKRRGYEPYARRVNVNKNMNLNVALEFTNKEKEKWKNDTAFLYKVQKDKRLTETEIDTLISKARTLEKNGYILDFKIDTKEGLKIRDTSLLKKLNKSLK